MVTIRNIQRELAEFRRMIQQDFRTELRAALHPHSLCAKCKGNVAALRSAADGHCPSTPPLCITGCDAKLDTLRGHQDETTTALRHSAAPLLDERIIPMSARRPSSKVPPGVDVDSTVAMPPNTSPFPLPGSPDSPDDMEHDVRSRSNSKASTAHRMRHELSCISGRPLDAETKMDEALERWVVLCLGALQNRSITHECWLQGGCRPSFLSIISLSMLPTSKTSGAVVAPEAWWIVDPFSTRRFSWDLIGIGLCINDLIMVPVQSAFPLPQSYEAFRVVRDCFTTCFWTLDILMSFATGSPDKDGLVETDPWKIARKYMGTWFVLDLLIVTIDWIIIFLSALGVSGSMRIGKAFTRILRASRLLRILKMSQKIQEVMGTVQTELLFTMVTVMKQVVFLLLTCHYLACAWYNIGTIQDGGGSWTDVFLSADHNVVYAYAVSLYFSLTLFTLGNADIAPQTTSEHFFVSFVLVVAVLVFALFTSAISRAVTHLEEVNSVELAQDVLIRQFCSENDVPRQLTARVRSFRRERSRSYNRRMVNESDVEIFQSLPKGIIQQLREHRFMRHLLLHPLFHQYSTMNLRSLQKLCWYGIEEAFLLPGRELFREDEDVNRMFFLLTGKLRYRSTREGDIMVLPGQWACEETLWAKTSWLAGPFVACDGSQLMLIDPEKLREIATESLFSLDFLSEYAKLFTQRFNDASRNLSDDCVLFNDPFTLQNMVREAWKGYARATGSPGLD